MLELKIDHKLSSSLYFTIMKKGIFHLHTSYSFDCLVPPYKLVEKAKRLGISYLVISDHDSLKGSIEANHYAKEKGYEIEVPISGEFLTDIGDIVVVGVPEDFEKIKDHKELCKEVKRLGGYTVLPHPYDYHKLDEIDFSHIDLIEVFNSRSAMEKNLASLELALRLNKPAIYGSDAHFLGDMDKAVFYYSGENPFSGVNYPLRLESTSLWSKDCSQLVRSWKIKSPKVASIVLKRMFKRMYRK